MKRVLVGILLVGSTLVGPAPAAPAAPAASPADVQARAQRATGTVVAARRLAREKWIPNVTRRAFVLKYVTTDANGNRTFSTGRVFIPKGRPPAGGWPVVSWAHGTTGLADRCAPSRLLPSARDARYLGTWMRQGYAVVASDYAGLGTRGLMAYLHGRSTAHNVVDMVLAARSFTAHRKPAQRLARKWVVIGQSQGAGGAIYTARHATKFGGKRLDYRGAVGMAMPERGFDKPFFMGHGALDTDVPLATTLPYVTALLLGGEPVTFRTYVSDHSGTMAASLKDSVPFVARLLR